MFKKPSCLCIVLLNPTMTNKGVQGAFDRPCAKTVIPRKVTGKFSVRLVPDQDPPEIERLVITHLKNKFKERNSPNKLKLHMNFI